MASIDLTDVSLYFRVRQKRRMTLKEFLIHRMFRSSVNPYIEVRALDGVDLHMREGDRVGILGHNGAGKTTLLRALLKEVPYRGEMRFHCGHDHTRPTPEHIGYVPQKLRIEGNLPLTVLDLATMKETHLAETRSVDDQAEWDGNDRVVYGVDGATWSVPADGSGRPTRLAAAADSPAVIAG